MKKKKSVNQSIADTKQVQTQEGLEERRKARQEQMRAAIARSMRNLGKEPPKGTR